MPCMDLERALRCWNKRFNQFTEENIFRRCRVDVCLYIGTDLWLVIWVDDILLIDEKWKMKELAKWLRDEFGAKDMGDIQCFVGTEEKRVGSRVELCQHKLEEMLEWFNVEECKTCSTPIEDRIKVRDTDAVVDVPPDITIATSYLSWFLNHLTHFVWNAARSVNRYLKGIMNSNLIYEKCPEEYDKVIVYADANWGAKGSDTCTVLKKADEIVDEAQIWFLTNTLQLSQGKTQRLLCTLGRQISADDMDEVKFIRLQQVVNTAISPLTGCTLLPVYSPTMSCGANSVARSALVLFYLISGYSSCDWQPRPASAKQLRVNLAISMHVCCEVVTNYILDGHIMGSKSAPRTAKLRAKKKETPEKWNKHLKKERDEVRCGAQKMKCEESDFEVCFQNESSYTSKSTLRKAVFKATRKFPSGSSKKKTVIQQLIKETFDKPSDIFAVEKLTKSKDSQDGEKIEAFYETDDVSWQAPGMRHFISIKNQNGEKIKKQKRYLIMGIDEVRRLFVQKHGIKVRQSRFYELCPKYVLFVDLRQEPTWKEWSKCSGQLRVQENIATLEDIVFKVNASLPQFKIHTFVRDQQLKYFDNLKNLDAGDTVIEVDFAENYCLILQDEIQTAHWSHSQVTIFTCCLWLKGFTTSSEVISHDLCHSKHSAWTYVKISVLRQLSGTLLRLGAVDAIGGNTKQAVWTAMKAQSATVQSPAEFCKTAETHPEKTNVLYVSEREIQENSTNFLDQRWKNVRDIHGIRNFIRFDDVHISVALTSTSLHQKVQVKFPSLKIVIKKPGCYKYNDAYSNLETDSEKGSALTTFVYTTAINPEAIAPGIHVVINFKGESKEAVQHRFVSVCQTSIYKEQTNVHEKCNVTVLFLKKYGSNGKVLIRKMAFNLKN
ncbi:hypothetical protein PR048_023638 [Dryococelus australis]|uniref:Reverse transcriptase Ty1/copia-type domain-containing protein n=1 Tax=Dryococelus australis TaxID=614101 RepID=A0ABQ9GUU9_9NEOP|nr:hypothetical protein PR048_023638 [Dryococelus australis]